jgi:hypothetical protein
MIVRPRGARGKCIGIERAGCAASTAASNMRRSSARSSLMLGRPRDSSTDFS